MKFISISNFNGKKSKDWKASINRLNGALTYRCLPANIKQKRMEWYERINYNINYWKEHGKLPNNVNLDKVHGKGMYNEEARDWAMQPD